MYSRKQVTHQLDSPDFSQIKIIKSEKQSGQGFTGLRTFSGNILTPLKGNSLSKCIQLFFLTYIHILSHILFHYNELTHWKRPCCWERLRARREGSKATDDEMVGWHHQLNGSESEQTLGDTEGQGGLACCSPRGRKESDTTERPNSDTFFFIVFSIMA